jgi:hypothetical protein
MNLRVFAAIAASIMVAAAPASAKTKAECTKEWQANKAANQAAGKTEKAYVAECRGTAAAAPPAAKPTSGDSKERAY